MMTPAVLHLPKTKDGLLGSQWVSLAVRVDVQLVSNEAENLQSSCRSVVHMASWMDWPPASVNSLTKSGSQNGFQSQQHLKVRGLIPG